MKSFTSLLLALPALLLPSAVVADGDLHDLMVASGKLFFGTATDTNFLANDTTYAGLVNVTSEFGLLVPENSQKWDQVEAQAGVFDFTQPDRLVALAKANGQMMRCHTLVWHQQLPQFSEFSESVHQSCKEDES